MRITFSFGINWINYVKKGISENVIQAAKNSLLRYLPAEQYKDKVFIDVGCGSGLFSLCAALLGAKKVISFDKDPNSITATNILQRKFNRHIRSSVSWEVFLGDILDNNLILGLKECGDIVYCWGVLHHTGNMWQAIENTSKLVKKDGYWILGIYNHAPSSNFWLKVKKFYNAYPILQPLMIIGLGAYVIFGRFILCFLTGKKFSLRKERGMHVLTDVIDWLGGLPYEFACFDEVKKYVENLGFKLIKEINRLPCGKLSKNVLSRFSFRNTAVNEFLFQKQ